MQLQQCQGQSLALWEGLEESGQGEGAGKGLFAGDPIKMLQLLP